MGGGQPDTISLFFCAPSLFLGGGGNSLLGSDGGQSSHDTWDIFQPQGKWREISAEMDTVENTVKEKSSTWNKNCRESAKRETELYKMVEAAVMDEKQQEEERAIWS